jgi:hypothetical protein
METKTRPVTSREGIAGSDDGARPKNHHRFGQVARERLTFEDAKAQAGKETRYTSWRERDEGNIGAVRNAVGIW